MKTETLVLCICYALFFLFIYAAFSKLSAFDYYLYDLKRSPLLRPYATSIAWLVPGSEIIVAGMLIPKPTRPYGLAAAILLMVIFTAYVVYVLAFTSERPCTCGGIIRALTWPQHLFFNIGFLVIAIQGLHMDMKLPKRY